MRRTRGKGRTNVCGREGTCEKDEGGQKSVVERAHVRRTREEEGRTNVCGGEGACEKDGGY